MEEETPNIDRALGSSHAEGYLKRKRREIDLINGNLDRKPEPELLRHFEEAPKTSRSNIDQYPIEPAQPPQQAEPERLGKDESVIRIKDMREQVVIKCKFTGKNGRQKKFSVSVTAVNVNVTDNGIAIVLGNSRVSVDPPVMEQLMLVVNGVSYPVIFTGGVQEFGPFSTMYFTRLTDDVAEEKEVDT